MNEFIEQSPTLLTPFSRRTLLSGLGLAALAGATAGTLPSSRASATTSWNLPIDGPVRFTQGWDGTAYPYSPDGYHRALDMVRVGYSYTPVYSIGPGTVHVTGYSSGLGNYIVIAHPDSYYSLYAHLRDAPLVTTGAVQAAQQIGVMGGTPNFAIHLHLETFRGSYFRGDYAGANPPGGTRFDPMEIMRDAPAPGTQPVTTWQTLGEVAVYPSGWQMNSTNTQFAASAMSAVDMGRGWADVFVNQQGKLHHICVDEGSWRNINSGVPLDASSMSAMNVYGTTQIMAVVGDHLMHVSSDSGWLVQDTGVRTTGKISAVVMDDLSIQVMVNQNGILWNAWQTTTGWVKQSTGKQVGANFAAVNMGGGQAYVATVLNNQVHLIYPTSSGWTLQSTGIGNTNGPLTAVNMGGGYPEVYTLEGGNFYRTSVSGGAWIRQGLPSPAARSSGTSIHAVNLGGSSPRIYAAV